MKNNENKESITSGRLFAPTSLQYYRGICHEGQYKVTLTVEEAAVVLKAYDYGIWAINEAEVEVMNVVLAKLKDQIHP